MIVSWDLRRYFTKFNVLDFDPVFSDVHCRLHAELQFQKEIDDFDAIASTQEANNLQTNERPGRWNAEKTNYYLSRFDVDTINDLLSRMDEFSVEETSKTLKITCT